MKLIECVPNVSEGRNKSTLDALAAAVRSVSGVQLLDVDPGADTHRTVFTFVGPPENMAEAAFLFIKTAVELIDMRLHHGAHPRLGAVDVVPFVPIGGGATMEDCVALARQLGARVGAELDLPVFLYERAASKPARRSLAEIRQGEYEGLAAKLLDHEWAPDFGPAEFRPKAGAVVIGARPFLIAYNVNLNTQDRKLAHEIALRLREQGRSRRGDDGKLLKDAAGNPLKVPGKLSAVRAVGWTIPEFRRAQISFNLLDFNQTAAHTAFDASEQEAQTLGVRVTGSELVGLIPREALLAAGRHYLERQGKTSAAPEPDLIETATVSLGLNDVKPFDPQQAVIEYRLRPRPEGLAALTVTQFVDELSRPSPAPGGGSAAALLCSLGASLVAMVAALTHGSGKSEQLPQLVELGAEAQALKDRMLLAIDRDARAFDAIVAARRLPKKSTEELAARQLAIETATREAIESPLAIIEAATAAAALVGRAVSLGLAAAASDCGVAAWCAKGAAEGGALNVRINLSSLGSAAEREGYAERTERALRQTHAAADAALLEIAKKL